MQFFWPWFGFTFIQTSNGDQWPVWYDNLITLWKHLSVFNPAGIYIKFVLSKEWIELSLTTKQFHSWLGSFIGDHSNQLWEHKSQIWTILQKNYNSRPFLEQNKVLKEIKYLFSCSFIDRNMKQHIHNSQDELVILLCNVEQPLWRSHVDTPAESPGQANESSAWQWGNQCEKRKWVTRASLKTGTGTRDCVLEEWCRHDTECWS